MEGDRFCGACGAAIEAAADSAAQQPQVERRHVSVLFADLVGFTPLSLQRDAEEVRDLLSRYFQAARSSVQRYGGTVEKFIGDAVMAVWGVPVAQEDDAERAVRAALEVVDAVTALGAQLGEPALRARAGVLTGEAAVNLAAAGEGMVAGDLVNTASRLQSAAEAGTVCVGDATRAATQAAIEYADAGEHQLKGKPDAVRLWRAVRVVAGRGGSMRPAGLEPPFTGRDHELRLLKEYLHATTDEGRARLLSIVGLPGVGKSRLTWEFEKYVDGITQAVLWHRGRCLPYGEGVTYWALAEMVRMRCGMAENEPSDEARQKLRAAVEEYVGNAEERRWVEPRLGQLLGLEEGSATDPRDLFAAWRFFFEQLARVSLTVLVLEDLQWADSGLFDFLEYLLEWSRNSPILVITLARPELSERRPGWGSGRRGMTSLFLEPLQPEAMEQLLTGMVPGLPDELRARIRDRAAGIPLYAVETVRMLLDRGLIREQDGVFEVRGSLESLEVPESLHAMIAARIDSLPAAERRLVQDAAVLGKSFTAAALDGLSDLDLGDLEPLIERLVTKDIFTMQSDPRSPERGQYSFMQELMRSVALGTLSRHDRKMRHIAAAAYLASAWSEEDEIAEVIAQHLVDAYEAEPNADDAAAVRDRARAALVRAAERAASLAANAAALRYYERALALGGDDPETAVIHERAGELAAWQGNSAAGREHLQIALGIHERDEDVTQKARVVCRLAMLDIREGHFDRSATSLRDAMEVLAASVEENPARDAVLAEAATVLASGRYFMGDAETALPLLEQALTVADRGNMTAQLVIALDVKSWLLQTMRRSGEALLLSRGAWDLAGSAGLVREAARIGQNLAELLEEADDLQPSIDSAILAEHAAQRAGMVQHLGYARLERIFPLLELGRWEECEELLALVSDQGGMTSPLATFNCSRLLDAVWLHLRRGRVDAARELIAEVEATQTNNEATNIETALMLGAARAALHNAGGSFGPAFGSAESVLSATRDKSFPIMERKAMIEAVEAAFGLDDRSKLSELLQLSRKRFAGRRQPSMDAHLLRWEGRLAALNGDGERAHRQFQAAIKAFTELGRPFWTAVTQLECAEFLEQAGQPSKAEPHRSNARATFERLGAQPWIERAEAPVDLHGRTTARALP